MSGCTVATDRPGFRDYASALAYSPCVEEFTIVAGMSPCDIEISIFLALRDPAVWALAWTVHAMNPTSRSSRKSANGDAHHLGSRLKGSRGS